jgi:hypothetical protein
MLLGVYIFRDDEFDDPLYGEPSSAELDEALWEEICETANDAIEGQNDPEGSRAYGEGWIAWRWNEDLGLTFVAAVTDDVRASQVSAYLSRLARRYLDEVDDPRSPDRMGVVDVVIDVVPPWDED